MAAPSVAEPINLSSEKSRYIKSQLNPVISIKKIMSDERDFELSQTMSEGSSLEQVQEEVYFS